MSRLFRHESGFALPMALGIIMVLGILSIAASSFMLSNGENAVQSRGGLQALQYAEGGLDAAYSLIWNANANGQDPTASGLVGTTASPKVFCLIAGATCTGTYVAGTASVFGCYGGTNGTTCNGTTVAPSTWLIVSTGYAAGGGGAQTRVSKTMTSTIVISPLNSGQVAALWNHLFLTAPLVANTCQTTITGNTLTLYMPIYSIGNLCFTGNAEKLVENGQAVDLMVGGKLVISDTNSSIGQDAGHPITSGVVVGGCNATSPANATSPCNNGSFKYWVRNSESFIPQEAPTMTATQIEQHYTNADPGPKNTCLPGTTPAPLNDNQLDFSVSGTEGSSTLPDTSGSGSSGGTFNLTPASSYACISKNGTDKGYLIWNAGNSSFTVSGITVPAKTLAINGAIFVDSNVSVTQSATYTGTAVIMAAGTITWANSNSISLCATSGCNLSNWQGNSGNNSMLTLAPLAVSAAALSFPGNSATFQGSLYTQPTSPAGLTIGGNTVTLEGPMSIGTVTITGNTPDFYPLPVIQNMPVGAPLPPNTGVTIGTMTVTK
jgi:Tfp pilus assembly protein PilX